MTHIDNGEFRNLLCMIREKLVKANKDHNYKIIKMVRDGFHIFVKNFYKYYRVMYIKI